MISIPKNPKADDLVPILSALDVAITDLAGRVARLEADAGLLDLGARVRRLEELEQRRRRRYRPQP